MNIINASVGRGGLNKTNDVRTVQELLNKHQGRLGFSALIINGLADVKTIAAIEQFQRQIVKLAHPDGRIDPGGRTLAALTSVSGAGGPSNLTATNQNLLSGAKWWHANQVKYPNSSSIDDLETAFRIRVQEFLTTLKTSGATVNVRSTRRSKQRAYLMHYSWKIAGGLIQPSSVPTEPGVDIVWDHGDAARSRLGAQEMVHLFQVVYQPSLNSRHIEGRAIDMDISWTGSMSIKNKNGQVINIGSPHNGAHNTQLHMVGASYGVIKLLRDKPHWSSDGR